MPTACLRDKVRDIVVHDTGIGFFSLAASRSLGAELRVDQQAGGGHSVFLDILSVFPIGSGRPPCRCQQRHYATAEAATTDLLEVAYRHGRE